MPIVEDLQIKSVEISKDYTGIETKRDAMKCFSECGLKQKIFHASTQLLLSLFLVGSLYGTLEEYFLPGSEVFALWFLASAASVGGLLMRIVRLPSLLGMLLIGMLLKNWPYIPYAQHISPKWSSVLRDCALTIILLKAGLGLDPEKLSKLKLAVFKLSFIPCLCEALSSAIFSYYLLSLPWIWSLMLGFILCAVSAAVLVPGVLELDSKGLGTNKGIPTLLLASVSIDNIISLTGFFVTFSILTSEEVYIGTLLKRPLEPFLGLLIGGAIGFLAWWLPSSSSSSLLCERILLLCLGGACFTFLSKKIEMAGAGALGCVSFAFVASLEWRRDESHFKHLTYITGLIWTVLEIFLFGLIGTQVTLESLKRDLGISILVLFLGVLVRFLSTALCLGGSRLNCKEKVFISSSWISKATVQAAVGSQALEIMIPGTQGEMYGQQVLSMSVLAIILTAPLGAMVMDILGPYLLREDQSSQETDGEKQCLIHVTVTDYSTEENAEPQHTIEKR